MAALLIVLGEAWLFISLPLLACAGAMAVFFHRHPLSLLAGLLENEVLAGQSAASPQLADGGRLTADGDGHAFLA